jgi:hypothetical protein
LKLKLPLSAAAKIVRHGLLCAAFSRGAAFSRSGPRTTAADGGVTPENATPNAKPSSQRRDAA